MAFRMQGNRFIAADCAKRDPPSAPGSTVLFSQSSDLNLFIETTLRTFAQANTREAAVWLANQPPSPQTDGFMNQVMAMWTGLGSLLTARWSTELQKPALLSKSITCGAEPWAKVDTDGLAACGSEASPTTGRGRSRQNRVWMGEDPAHAAQWAGGGIAVRGTRK